MALIARYVIAQAWLHGEVKLAFVLIPGEGRAAGGEYASAISSRARRARRVLASGREDGGIAPK
jgi:hypothetical protein